MADCPLPQDSLFLGFDTSTQSLKATILDSNLNIVETELIHFDSDLPHYKTKDGVHRDATVNGRIVSPTLMWVEAFDMMLLKLSRKIDFGKVAAVSGSAQQHGSVYWNNGSSVILSSLDPKKQLVEQLMEAFSIKESPIWMDSSTTEQCKKIEEAVGGALELSRLTGSRAHERYTGPQIRRIFETQPEIYKNTERISLVSSFMASLLVGGYSCIDETDGAGMNLLDIKQKSWSKKALDATSPHLEEKLGKPAPAYAVAGLISTYFVERFHFSSNCLVIQWSGDNPNSLAASLPGGSFDVKIDVPELTGDNFKVWKERVLLHLGFLRFDYAIQNDEPAEITGKSTPDQVDLREKWVKSNYLCTLFIKTKLCASIRGSVDKHTKVRDLLKAIDEQFETSHKALASTLIMQFTSLKLNATKGVRDFIMRMRDTAAQLKELEVTMSDTFLVHFILCSLPTQYAPFKISYNTHKDKWSLNELLTMCVQEEGRLLLEEGEKVNLTTSTDKASSSTKYKAHHKDKGKGKIPAEQVIKKESSCFFCKKKGHMKKDCVKFKAWLKKKGYDKPSETSGK